MGVEKKQDYEPGLWKIMSCKIGELSAYKSVHKESFHFKKKY